MYVYIYCLQRSIWDEDSWRWEYEWAGWGILVVLCLLILKLLHCGPALEYSQHLFTSVQFFL